MAFFPSYMYKEYYNTKRETCRYGLYTIATTPAFIKRIFVNHLKAVKADFSLNKIEELYSRWVASAAHCVSESRPLIPANKVSVKQT